MWRAAAGGFLLSAAAVAAGAPAGDCRVPSLKVEASSPRPRQGEIVAVTLESSVPLASAKLSDGKHTAAMERDSTAGGRVLHVLWGVDFESSLGARRVRVEARGLCGDAHGAAWDLKVASGRFPEQKLTVDPAYVEPPPSEKERIERERAEVGRVWAAAPTARRWSEGFRLPVDAPLRPNFGAKRVFNGQPRSRHNGVDLAAPPGAPVTAPAAGTVVLAEEMYFSGGTVILDHGGGLFTTYFHLSRIDVKAGDRAAAGARIGAVGATGRATGPHLHWGARLHGARVNPLDLLKLPRWAPSSPEQ
ncbi:MAG: M23 family metallopeptidase [Acidobacteriota bacterium]